MSDDMEKIRNILKLSMIDLIKEIRVKDDAQIKKNKTDPTPIISFDHYQTTYLPAVSKTDIIKPQDDDTGSNAQDSPPINDEESNKMPISSPRFEYDYGFNPLIYLADCIERNSKL